MIDRALQALFYLEGNTSADATDSALALDELNQMMARWEVSDKDLGWFPQDTLADTVPVPDWALDGVLYGLAVNLGPVFNMPVPPDVFSKALGGEKTITRTLINLKLKDVNMRHVHWGENGRWDIDTDQ